MYSFFNIYILFYYLFIYLFIFNQVFFPIFCADHFFLICFDLTKHQVLIIDSSSIDEENENRYCCIPELLVRKIIKYINIYIFLLLFFKKLCFFFLIYYAD